MISTDRKSASLGDSIIQYWVMLIVSAACVDTLTDAAEDERVDSSGDSLPDFGGRGRANQPAR